MDGKKNNVVPFPGVAPPAIVEEMEPKLEFGTNEPSIDLVQAILHALSKFDVTTFGLVWVDSRGYARSMALGVPAPEDINANALILGVRVFEHKLLNALYPSCDASPSEDSNGS